MSGWAARLGREYLPDSPPVYKTKKSAQDAHEAMRPSSVAREPKALTRFLSKDQLALYRLIWERFLASQMLPAVYDTVTADITAGEGLFRAQGSTLKFAGFTAVYVESRDESAEPAEDEQEAAGPAAHRGRDPPAPVARSQAALHAAAPALHRGVAGEDARGAGHRPPVHVRADPLHHPGPRVRAAGQGHALPHRARHAGDRHARAALPRGDGRGVHRPAGGVPRQDRGGRTRTGRRRWAPSTRSSPRTSARPGRRWRTSRKGSTPARPARSAASRSWRSGAGSASSSPARPIPTASTPRISEDASVPPTSPPTRPARPAARRWSSSTVASASSWRARAIPSARRPSRCRWASRVPRTAASSWSVAASGARPSTRARTTPSAPSRSGPARWRSRARSAARPS